MKLTQITALGAAAYFSAASGIAQDAALMPAAAPPVQTLTPAESYADLVKRGNEDWKSSQYNLAQTLANRAIALDFNRYEAWALSALCSLELGKTAQAQNNLDEAIRLAPAGKEDALLALQQRLADKINVLSAGASSAATDAVPAPGDSIHVVKMGDTLVKIAKQAGVSVQAIESENNLTGLQLKVGQRLKIPAATGGIGGLEKRTFPDFSGPWTNSLGQAFVPVAGTAVLFGVWDVRVQDFEAFVNATSYDATSGMYSLRNGKWGQNGDTWKNPGFSQGPTHPVCGVSWNDAKAFCEWLTKKERSEGKISETQSYRLPQEAEWNRAVGNTKYPWGDAWPPPSGAGNYAGSEAKDGDWNSAWVTMDGYQDGYARTSPVGSFQANQFGLYDMGGNVLQWCEDWYDSSQQPRVLRGASWYNYNPDNLLSSCRSYRTLDYRNCNIGFRCVLAAAATQ